ncbi:hypothetical protein C8P66_11295 [Humitalea rosea]|uniref:Uracil DNA glycosylase superfamily protein n=1 Tax=Humitalea rosea TaxID=990373 RepID=A0A2W7IEJ9_9PROT|nr:hypothetical protein C8P66_11295 [Humitalea rosea]
MAAEAAVNRLIGIRGTGARWLRPPGNHGVHHEPSSKSDRGRPIARRSDRHVVVQSLPTLELARLCWPSWAGFTVHSYIEVYGQSSHDSLRPRCSQGYSEKGTGTVIPSYSFAPGADRCGTVILLSAAGNRERSANRPAAGQTGKNIAVALRELRIALPQVFPETDLEFYRIVNASSDVHFRRLTERTEATDAEIRNPANLARVRDAVGSPRYLVILGRKAWVAAEWAQLPGERLSACHPAHGGINRKYTSTGRTPSERNHERISLWGGDLIQSLSPSCR